MIAEEVELAARVGGDEHREQQPSEQLREHAHGQEEAGGRRIQRAPSFDNPPPGTIMCTCGWWVMALPQVCSTAVMPILAPRCFGSAAIVSIVSAGRLEQQVVDHALVLVGDVGDLGRQREHDVEVGDGQQLGLACCQPLPRRRALALRAVPVAAAVVGDHRVAAGVVLAARDMAAERRRAAVLDRTHHLHLVEADAAAVGLTPRGTVVAEDVRDLQGWPSHANGRLAGRRSAWAQSVEWARHRAERTGRDMRVARGRVELRVTEQDLDHADIGVVSSRCVAKV